VRIALLLAVIALGSSTSCTKSQGEPPVSSAALPPPTPPALPTASASASPSASAAPLPAAASARPVDIFPTPMCDVKITPLHHATLLLECGALAIYVDPVHDVSYAGLPKAGLVLITDIHGDHFDPAGLDSVRQDSTTLVVPSVVAEKLPPAVKNVIVLKNGASQAVLGLQIDAVPMYNLTRGPKPGALFHDKGRGNGYILAFQGKRIYLSGDTECTPEMKALKNIEVAFVCMNLPYTMPPSEAAACVNAFRPRIVYPYHYRGSDPKDFEKAVTAKGVEVQIRDWYAP
jgi:L-ascorbate metabolism protein UlaG (beta-lactamase superfamily)